MAVCAFVAAALLLLEAPARAQHVPPVETSVAQERSDKKADNEDNDIPLGGFAIALLIAALIGAAGGYVYAGIMGPKR